MFRWLSLEPAQLVARRQWMLKQLEGYPVWAPPHRQGPNATRLKNHEENLRQIRDFKRLSDENFEYFLRQRSDRIEALRVLLGGFNAIVATNDAGLEVVSDWFAVHSGTLVSNLRLPKARSVFFDLAEEWNDHWIGLNVIFDLGLFFGECIIARNARLFWELSIGVMNEGPSHHSGFVIGGFKSRKNVIDPIARSFRACLASENVLRANHSHPVPNAQEWAGVVRDYATRQ